MIYLSKSTIGQIDDCYGKYYFSKIKKIPVIYKLWPGTLYGYLVDAQLEDIINLRNSGKSKREILVHIKDYFEKNFQKIIDREKAKGNKFTKSREYDEFLFIENGNKFGYLYAIKFLDYLENVKTISSQHKLQYKWPLDNEIIITGYLDMLLEYNDNKILILDAKATGDGMKFKEVNFGNDVQSTLYMCGLKEKNVLTNQFTYFVLDHKAQEIFDRTHIYSDKDYEKHINMIDLKIKEAKRQIQENSVDNYKPDAEKCRWCDFNKHCDESVHK